MQATAEPMRGEGLGAGLTDERAREIYRQGEEAVVFALLQQAKLLTEADHTGVVASNAISPSTPSGMKPVYTKPPASSRKKRPGRRNGHPGARRKVPDRNHHARHRNVPEHRPIAATTAKNRCNRLKSYKKTISNLSA